MCSSEFYSALVMLVADYLVYLFFVLAAFRGQMKLRTGVRHLLLCIYVMASVVIILLFLLEVSPLWAYKYPMLCVWLGGTILMGMLLLRSNLLQLLFLIFVILDVQFNITQISKIIYHLDIFPRVFADYSTQLAMINIIMLAVFVPFIGYIFITFFRKVVNMNIDKSYWRHMFTIPISFYLYSIFTSINHSIDSSDHLLTELFMLVLLNVCSFMAYTAVLMLMIKTHDGMVATEKAAYARQQMALQNEQYKKLAEDVGEAQRMRHDMRHHLITIKGYLELGKLESASGYIDGLVGKDHYNDGAAICNNHAVNMILRHYLGLAREDNVRVVTDVRLPRVFAMTDQDLCAIFGNLVENAVESCKRQDSGEKFITIKAKVIHDNMLALTVTNSYSGNIIRHGDDFVSQKHDGTGIGTWSVRSIAEKSGGNCKFTFADKVFKASVLFTP